MIPLVVRVHHTLVYILFIRVVKVYIRTINKHTSSKKLDSFSDYSFFFCYMAMKKRSDITSMIYFKALWEITRTSDETS